MSRDDHPGRNYPLGATVYPSGVNFSIFSRNAEHVELCLFDHPDDPRPARVIPLTAAGHRTFHYWHVFVSGIGAGQLYGYRVFGPRNPARGLCFDGAKLLVDPYAKCVAPSSRYDRTAAGRPGDNAGVAIKSVVVDRRGYDWEGDEPLKLPFERSIIYELHVAGFTRHPSSGVTPARRGTYAGLVEKIPYLQELGVNAVELMPVQQFDPQDNPAGLVNYWGYSPVAFFAPHRPYSSRTDPLGPVDEFRDMVKALHRAGIEVILDVVFNHTCEGGADGVTLSWRGLENQDYYILDPEDPSRYANFSGCGNTLDSNQAVVRRMIMDCLRYWVAEMHVDGFRFDLASTMARDERGGILPNPPLLWDIESDPILASTKIIAEAWDAAGLYQVGRFVGHRWAEWNGKFRDDVRRFLKGDGGLARAFAERMAGSRDLYSVPGRSPSRSINFVTCHDGFTLQDLVSYDQKHNLANGEDNRDGSNDNASWNCGVEGPTDDPDIEALRLRQIKNHLAVLLLSQGTPMLLMGDEMRRTQHGNNNAHCHDSELSWLDWGLREANASLVRFVRELICFTTTLEVFNRDQFWAEASPAGAVIRWHGVQLGGPDWGSASHSVAFSLDDGGSGEHVYVMVNAYWEPLSFELPALRVETTWRRIVDTALRSPEDVDLAARQRITDGVYILAPRSVVVLQARP